MTRTLKIPPPGVVLANLRRQLNTAGPQRFVNDVIDRLKGARLDDACGSGVTIEISDITTGLGVATVFDAIFQLRAKGYTVTPFSAQGWEIENQSEMPHSLRFYV